MSSVQPHLPTETSKGTGIPGFSSSLNSFSDFVARATNSLGLGSVFGLGRSGDMNKPGNVGAPRPLNTLSNNSTSSRSPYGLVPSAHSRPSSPPPPKRQKLDEGRSNSAHSRATFAVIDSVSPRKGSIGSVSIPDSQRSIASNISNSQPSLAEYRNLDRHTKPKRKRSRTNRGELKSPKQEVKENLRSRPDNPPKDDEDTSGDEVNFVHPQKTPTNLYQPNQGGQEQRPITEYANRFITSKLEPQQMFSRVIDKVEKTAKKVIKLREPDFGPDELTSGPDEVTGGRPAKRPKPSPSLSRRGNITETQFTSAATSKSSAAMKQEHQMQADNKRRADSIIGSGLHVLRGASGRCKYQAGHEDDPDPLFLSIREIGHTLHAVDQERELLTPYRYLTLDLNKVKAILRANDEEECHIVVVIAKGVSLANGAGARLMVEFASKPDHSKFFQWVANYRRTFEIHIKDCKRTKLERDLEELMRRATSHGLKTDAEIEASHADDIRVIQHNHNGHVSGAKLNSGVANELKTRPKLRDAMKSSPTSRPGGSSVDRLASAQRQMRTTRSTFAVSDSPELSESEPEGWTSLNPGWEKQWRNSLVYPDTGKNRATVDKDDIQRLDEGQFLNDNIIIFYLRYLQKNLEDTNKDLARRVFFQNTFLFDKLKPTTGRRINYDSVKTWTSKVDLFSKDYIIVPINEFTHWYVAIICNAPALLSSSTHHEQVDDNKNSEIVVPNGVEKPQETSEASSQNEVARGSISGDRLAVALRDDVVENLRRMSIDSSDQLSYETRRKTENNTEEEVEVTSSKNDYPLQVVEVDKPEAEVEHIHTASTLQTRKKTEKRSNTGSPKCDPNQPRIITLDSLGQSHAPTCNYLKQYLTAELKDKKGIEIPALGAIGLTAKDIPEQTNHCDCGLFLLGYIQQFLLDPDAFVKSLLQRDNNVPWCLDPSALRNNIRDLIFGLQKEQQERENAAQEIKRQARMSQSQTKGKETLGHTTTLTTNRSDASPVSKPMTRDTFGSPAGARKSPRAPSSSRPPSSRGSSVILGVMNPLTSNESANHAKMRKITSSSIQSDEPRTTQLRETGDHSKGEKIQAKLRLDPHVVTSLRKTNPTSGHESHDQIPSTVSSSPVRGQAAEYHSVSPVSEAMDIQNRFIRPLSGTSSPKGSRGATPLDPLVVDDSDNNGRARLWQSPQRYRENRQNCQLVVEIPSSSKHDRSPRQSSKTDGRKQTGEQSSYFATRPDGERVISAKLREEPRNDVIDLSDD